MSLVETKPVTALAPVSDLFTVRTGFIAEYLGRKIAECRGTQTITETATKVLASHGVAIDSAAIERISDLVMQDTLFDSEEQMATRAALTVLKDAFGGEMLVSGWIPGRRIARDHDVFILINEACPHCRVNPLAHGHGGGVRCLNTRECGYSFCY